MKKNFQPITHELLNTMSWMLRSLDIDGVITYEDDYTTEERFTVQLLNKDDYVYQAEMDMSDHWDYDTNVPKAITILETSKHFNQRQRFSGHKEGEAANKLLQWLTELGFIKIALPEKEPLYKYKYVEGE